MRTTSPNHRTSPRTWTLFLVILLATVGLTACCDGVISVTGRVVDASTGQAMDSTRVTLYYVVKRKPSLVVTTDSDSTGRFDFWEPGFCGTTDFFISISKPDYRSEVVTVDYDSEALEVALERE